MQNIKKSKYRLKDVIEGKTSNDEKSAQKFVQLSHIKKNVQEFNELKSTLQDRKVTFAKFAFRQQELIDDKKLGPVLKGICTRTRIGSMQITELIPKFDLYKFLKQSQQLYTNLKKFRTFQKSSKKVCSLGMGSRTRGKEGSTSFLQVYLKNRV
ncbi:unnamed protein product [Paramecium octaurelia]|uniref:Ribosomal protein L10 n=1 Tax=Paramecium octaurelia TaxID=43137 RepID=A0A8S1UCX5_PAROT|nr:unnamed protein product [Paramecium octaurelia]